MANLQDIVELSEALVEQHVDINEKRCVAVRNRNARCKKCVEVCPANAITVGANKISINHTECVACGICSRVCPTNALIAKNPSDEELMQGLEITSENTEGKIYIACARVATLNHADTQKFVQVPCLSRVDEASLLLLASRRPSEITLIDGNCSTCKYRKRISSINECVNTCNHAFELVDAPVRITKQTGFPQDIETMSDEEYFAQDRRLFFSSLGSNTIKTGSRLAKTTIKQKLGEKNNVAKSVISNLKVNDKGVIPQIESKRHERILDTLFSFAEESGRVEDETTFESKFFGVVSIEASKCRACSMCVTFCPTGAIVKPEDAESEADKNKTSSHINKKQEKDVPYVLEFSPSKCVGCHLCENVCISRAIHVDNKLSLKELFAFEPQVFDLGIRRGNSSRLFGTNK